MTNFIRYNPTTGDIIDYGYMEPQYVQAEIDEGKPTLFAQNVYDFTTWKVDLATMTLVPRPPDPPEPITPALEAPATQP